MKHSPYEAQNMDEWALPDLT